jgi:hypothetical protein
MRVAMDLARKVSAARAAGAAGGITVGGLVSGEDIRSVALIATYARSLSMSNIVDVNLTI